MPIKWTVAPPEFAAYVSSVSCVDLGPDALLIEVDMRCKRVPTSSQERTEDTPDDAAIGVGVLDIRFSTGIAASSDGGTMRLDHPDDDIVWPQALGQWNGPRPVLTVHHGRTGFGVDFSAQGRYTTSVMLIRSGLPRMDVDGPPCGRDYPGEPGAQSDDVLDSQA